MLTDILCLIVACLIVIIFIQHYRRISRSNPPGPYPWPIVGNLYFIRRLCKELGHQHKAFVELAKRYNSNVINLYFGSSNIIVVCGYDAVQQILKNDNFDARPWNEFIKIRNMGMKKGITFADGPEWKEMRAWLLKSLRNLGFGKEEMSDKIHDELRIILDKLSCQNNKCIRMKPIIVPAVINVIWTLATGKRISDDTRLKYFLGIMERRAEAFDVAGGILSIFPWLRHIAPKSTGYEVLITLNDELKSFLIEIINDHKENYVKDSQADLIDMFLTEMYFGKGKSAGFDEDQLLMILADLFIAGFQTTAITLDFLFLYMTVHQDIQNKLQDELDSVIDQSRLPQMTDKSILPFTEAVMTESQRLRLIVPIIGPRRTLNDTIIDGYRIPKDSCVLINIYSIHLNENNFQDPHSFKPDRHLHDGVFVPNKNLIFFGGGHRRCPGETVAKSAIFILFSGVMRHYKLLPVNKNVFPNTEPLPGLTISPKPYEVLIKKRFT